MADISLVLNFAFSTLSKIANLYNSIWLLSLVFGIYILSLVVKLLRKIKHF